MFELLKAMVVVILQRVPLINRLECVRNAGTVKGALAVLSKALAKLDKVKAEQASKAEATRESIRITREARDAQIASLDIRCAVQLAEAAKAEKVAANIRKLTE